MPMKPTPLQVRFWRHVDKRGPNDCWLWTGATNKGPSTRGVSPYGKLGDEYPSHRTVLAHRVSWRLANGGDPPPGFHVDHTCNVPLCVNPRHLRLLAPKRNNARSTSPTADNARKTHCPQGHEYTPENTGYRRGKGYRSCRTCARLSMEAKRERGLTYPEWRKEYNATRDRA